MVKSFACRHTQALFARNFAHRQFAPFARQAKRKLLMLDAAADVIDLRSPPGNRLEKLSGDRAGYYSIRINAQWRLVFRWKNGDAYDAEICDYH